MGSKDSCGGNGNQLDISDGHGGPLCLALGILEHVDILGDALGHSVVPKHLCWKVDKVDGKVADKFGGGDSIVEGLQVFQILVPRLVDGGTEAAS